MGMWRSTLGAASAVLGASSALAVLTFLVALGVFRGPAHMSWSWSLALAGVLGGVPAALGWLLAMVIVLAGLGRAAWGSARRRVAEHQKKA